MNKKEEAKFMIGIAKLLKNYCNDHENCTGCVFDIDSDNCPLDDGFYNLDAVSKAYELE